MLSVDFTSRSAWIFDLDGTLTRAIHDFDALRDRLGLPRGAPILETVATLGDEASQLAQAELQAWETDLAHRAVARPSAATLLAHLQARGCRLGVLTRNLGALAITTLEEAGLAHFFDPEAVLGRDDAEPKPSPEGIRILLDRWGANPTDAVMVGDYLFDLLSGRAAGTATVLLDLRGKPDWHTHADRVVRQLDELLINEP